jgi:hypothetical protein
MTRMADLTTLPIFNDEAIFIGWAKMIKTDIHNIYDLPQDEESAC